MHFILYLTLYNTLHTIHITNPTLYTIHIAPGHIHFTYERKVTVCCTSCTLYRIHCKLFDYAPPSSHTAFRKSFRGQMIQKTAILTQLA